MGRCISESRNDVLHFREGIKEQYEFPNSAILKSLITDLAVRVQARTPREYEWLHKGCWYLQRMAQHIDPLLFEMQTSCVESYIAIIDANVVIWRGIVNDISKLFHPNIPYDIQQCAGRCIAIIEGRIAAYELVKGEYQKCIRIIKERE